MQHHTKETTIYLKDYTPAPININAVDMVIDLAPTQTTVTTKLHYSFKNEARDITLQGEGLILHKVCVNGAVHQHYTHDEHAHLLHISRLPAKGVIETHVTINPKDNSALEGLYMSGNIFTTQCEAEGFRHITFFLDRPDILSIYTVTLYADNQYSTLLSNGNLQEKGVLDNNRHYAIWHDPFAKPCYLFALVAGDLALYESTFTTRSNKEVVLRLYTEAEYINAVHFAMQALKKAFAWDEQRFNLEYDLDIFHIVAIRDFNMGAMENKSLNIFNAKYLIGDSTISSDRELLTIESIIAHEYFHNYTGNRVTVRDWFQLSLKEGLTVFRDQEFTADHTSRALKRIDDVALLRLHQFTEDAGGLAHAVRPASYQEINNFYTATIYEKGAEIIRMLHTLLGEESFQQGFAYYIKHFDGKAARVEDFVNAMQHFSNDDIANFMLWYQHPGTPTVTLKLDIINANKAKLYYKQHNAKAPNVTYPIPLLFSCISGDGHNYYKDITCANSMVRYNSLCVMLDKQEGMLELHAKTPIFDNAILSVNRVFGAPIYIDYPRSFDNLSHIMLHDDDGFSRYEASYNLAMRAMIEYMNTKDTKLMQHFVDNVGKLLHGNLSDKALSAQILSLPQYADMAAKVTVINVQDILETIALMRTLICKAHKDILYTIYQNLLKGHDSSYNQQSFNARQLLGLCLYYLGDKSNVDAPKIIKNHYQYSNNMTFKMQALNMALDHDALAEELLQAFLNQYQNHDIVLDKYLSFTARRRDANIVAILRDFMQNSPLFSLKNPNKTRAFMGGFATANPLYFHTKAGYEFTKDFLLAIDKINPQNAARQSSFFKDWYKLSAPHKNEAKQVMQAILEHDISKDMREMVTRMLNN